MTLHPLKQSPLDVLEVSAHSVEVTDYNKPAACPQTLCWWEEPSQVVSALVAASPQPPAAPSGRHHALVPAQGGCGVQEQREQEHGSPQHPPQERVLRSVLRSWISGEAPRKLKQSPGDLRFLHDL